ncbi:Pde9a [Symbiodinium natans]|uniref:Pde9a protein n=1 Tax=Symbiodinium natans TaxID=878477 RepID=A0A812JLP9_9DINO|nr:Pde9a [Symbiodinium natans]
MRRTPKCPMGPPGRVCPAGPAMRRALHQRVVAGCSSSQDSSCAELRQSQPSFAFCYHQDPEIETTCRNVEAAWEEKYWSVEAALHEARQELASQQSRCAELESESGALEAFAGQLKSELELMRKQLSDLEQPLEMQKREPRETCGANSPAVVLDGMQGAAQDQSSLTKTSATACSECPCVGAEEWDPYRLLWSDLFPYLAVHDLVRWRVVSKQTRSPKALLDHVAEMGRLDRSEAVTEFANVVMAMKSDNRDFSITTACGSNVERQKFFGCRFWCLVLAKARATHFDEADVRRILRKNVRDLLGHCRAADSTVRKAAHQTLTWYGTRSLPVVQQLIANDMLGRMEELLSGSSNDSSLPKVVPCTGHLSNVVKSLSKLQRQQWASLLFRFLRHQPACQQELVEDLQMLWLSENDCRSG